MSYRYSPADGVLRYDWRDVIAIMKGLGHLRMKAQVMRVRARIEKTTPNNLRWYDTFRTYALSAEGKGELMVRAKPWYRGQDRADRGG